MSTATTPQTIDVSKAVPIEGFMHQQELEWLAAQAQTHQRIAEIGSYYGRSTRALCDHALGEVHAYDDFWGPRTIAMDYRKRHLILETFEKNLADHIASGKLTVHEDDHQNLKPEGLFDMIFIDGAHEYDAVKKDLETWIPHLAPGGLICGHDHDLAFPGVLRAVTETFGTGQSLVAPNTTIWYAQANNTPIPDLEMPANMRATVQEIFRGEYDIEGFNPEKPVILDIGANIGAFTQWAQHRWPNATIYAYEPHPDNFTMLQRNMPTGVIAHQVAVWNEEGTMHLYQGLLNCGEHSLIGPGGCADVTSDAMIVPTISAETLPPCDILKIDTEGAELVILSHYQHLDLVQAVLLEWHSIEDRYRMGAMLFDAGFACISDVPWHEKRGIMKWIREGFSDPH